MFNIRPNAQKAYETQLPNSGALALLMKALGGLGENAQGISQSAGTSIAEDRLAALTPEERAGANLSDRFGGLALTEQFKNKLAQADKDATAAKTVSQKQNFQTERDKTLHGYNMARDNARDKRIAARADKTDILPGQDQQSQLALQYYNDAIMKNETGLVAKDTQDGIGLGEKRTNIQNLKREKYNLLREIGYNDKTARDMTYTDSPVTKDLHKWISGNVYDDKKKK